MINVDIYIEKLDLLKEYMELKIDFPPREVWFDLQVCNDEYYFQHNLPLPTPYLMKVNLIPDTFEEWLNNKQN